MPRLLDDFPSVRFSFYINHHNMLFGRASLEELGDAVTHSPLNVLNSEWIMLILLGFLK